MSEAIDCNGCRKRMSATAAVCPHCGARQPGRGDPVKPRRVATASADDSERAGAKPVLTGLSPDEVKALLTVDAVRRGVGVAEEPPPPGTLADLLLPSPATRAGYREVEIALTIAAFPLLTAAFAMLPFFRRRRFDHPSAVVFGALVAGGSVMHALMTLGFGWSQVQALSLVGASCAAFVGRAVARRLGKRPVPSL